MKMGRSLALFLIVLMATTVVSTAGVLAAPKAAACGTTTTITLQYQPGKTYVFLPWQYNAHKTAILCTMVGTPQHIELAMGGTAYVWSRAKSIDPLAPQSICSHAEVGVDWYLKGVTAADMGNPCKVTMKVGYVIAAKSEGATSESFASIYVFAGSHASGYTVWGTDTVPVKKGTETFTYTGMLNDFFNLVGSNYFGQAHADARAESGAYPGQAQTTATATIYSITITF